MTRRSQKARATRPKLSDRRTPLKRWLENRSGLPSHAVAYVRVSTEDQDMGMQVSMLKEVGVPDIKFRMYKEKVSAADLRRPQFHLMVKMLAPGDTIYVYSFSRLFRSVKDLLAFIDDMAAKQVTVKSLTMPGVDLATAAGRAFVTMAATMDELERNQIKERTTHGMRERMRQGQRMGRPILMDKDAIRKAKAWRRQRVPVKTIASRLKVSPSAIYANT